MRFDNDRRALLRVLAAMGIGAAALTDGQESHSETRRREFHGVSRSGDLEEALRNAVAAAERAIPHPDGMAVWRLKGVSGRSGGIAGFREITVTVEAEMQ